MTLKRTIWLFILALTSSCTTPAALNFTLDTSATRPPLHVATIILLAISALGIATATYAGVRRRRWIAWRASFKRLGWVLPLACLGLILFVIAFPQILGKEVEIQYTVQVIVPLFMALQAAAIFAPDDEPALEIQLAAPRSVTWLVVERIAIVLLTYTVIAVIGLSIVTMLKGNLGTLWWTWLPPAMFLSGLALRLTMSSRLVALGMVGIGFLWVIFGLLADLFLPTGSYPFPLNILQPFLWVVHVHANETTFAAMGDYWLNRAFLAGAGLTLIMFALREVRDAEKVLLNLSGRQRSRKPLQVDDTHSTRQAVLSIKPVLVAIQPLRQTLGMMWYEMRMHWRRRAMKVFFLTLLLTVGTIVTVIGTSALTLVPNAPPVDLGVMSEVDTRTVYGNLITMMSSGSSLVLIIYMFPLLVADAAPLDTQTHVIELLRAAPQSQMSYLLGKVLGALLAGVIAVVISGLVLSVGWQLQVGAYDPVGLIQLFANLLCLLAINGTLAVLVGATQPTRLRAVMVAGLYFVVIGIAGSRIDAALVTTFLPNQAELFFHYIDSSVQASLNVPYLMPDFSLTSSPIREILIGGVLQIIIVWTTIWAWRRSQKG